MTRFRSRFKRLEVILMLLSVILLGLTFVNPKMSLQQATYHYVYVFDISQSMNVKDVGGKNGLMSRLNVAKQAAIDSLSKLSCGTEVGIALFTGHRAFLLLTPVESCKNQQGLVSTINVIDWTATWESRSEIAKGLYRSIKLMKQIGENTRLVFFTDGHEAPPINPKLMPNFSGKIGEIKGLIVGVGGDKLVKIPKLDRSGNQSGYWKQDEVVHVDIYTQERSKREGTKLLIGTEHLSSLREAYLESLAEKTGLTYHRWVNTESFLDLLEAKPLSHPKMIQTDIRWLLALLSLLLFGGIFLRNILLEIFAGKV